MAVTDLTIYKSNIVDGANLLAVHSPIVFLIDATYTDAPPESPDVQCFIYEGDRNYINAFRCQVFQDVYPGVRRFMFRADAILRGYMEGFEDFIQSDESLVPVPDITKQFTLLFTVAGVSPLPEVDIVACHAARQFGQTEAMTDIYNNEPKKYYAAAGQPVNVYFYNNDPDAVIGINDQSFQAVEAQDYDGEPFQDYDGTPFLINIIT
jgi:hypothetical protein